MESSDSQLRSPGVLTGFGARVLDQLSNRPVPLGAGAADVGATDFGSTSEPDTLMVLSPPVGFALVESVTSATVNDPPSTPDDNARQVVIPSQKSYLREGQVRNTSRLWNARNVFPTSSPPP